MKYMRYLVGMMFLGLAAITSAPAAELHDAAKSNDIARVNALIAQGVPVNSIDKSGRTALYWAAQEGHLPVLEILAKQGADINFVSRNDDNFTPLIVAAYNGYRDIVEFLATNGANLDAKDVDGYPALSWAWKQEHLQVAKLLILQGANVNVPEANEYGPPKGRGANTLLLATGHADDELIGLLVSHGANVNDRNWIGETLLFSAAEGGRLNVVKLLLDNNADVNATAYSYKRPAPILTATGRVKMGVYQEAGKTPLHAAVKGRNLEIVKLLVNRRAPLYARSSGTIEANHEFRYYSDLTPEELATFFAKYRPEYRDDYERIAGYLHNYLKTGGSLEKVSRAMHDYAVALKQHNRLADAQRIEQYAVTFSRTLSATESVYLGFDVSAVLDEYAGFLIDNGMGDKAIAVKELAAWYYQANVSAAVKAGEEYRKKQDDVFEEEEY